MRRTALDIKGVTVAGEMMSPMARTGWNLDNLAGRLVEVSGGADPATLTIVTRLIVEAQMRREPVAWISAQDSIFFPPDFAATGIDLHALPVVRVKKGLETVRALDTLLRSGGFALLVFDLGTQAALSLSVQTRLAGLVRKYHAALLVLTRKKSSELSLGSLISLWANSSRKQTAFNKFTCELLVLKDKRVGPGWRHVEWCCGPDGLC